MQIQLTRWDLFHAHVFYIKQQKSLGLLFHAKEYPQQCEAFPYNLGYCQRGSPMQFDGRGMDFRNLLYYQVLPLPRSDLCTRQLSRGLGSFFKAGQNITTCGGMFGRNVKASPQWLNQSMRAVFPCQLCNQLQERNPCSSDCHCHV